MKPKKILGITLICAFTAFVSPGVFAGDVEQVQSSEQKTVVATSGTTEPTPLDLLTLDEDYTGASSVRQGPSLGKQGSFHTDFDYGHRIHITGQWYLRLGVAYERYDFTRAISPLPLHLQAASATIAYEYVVRGFAGAAVELHPGFFFENDMQARDFAVPVDVYSAFKIKEDKLYGMVGFFTSPFIDPPVIPIGGVIWLINDKMRLEALFPRPSLIYTLNDDWEVRATGEINGYGFRVDESGRTPQTFAGSDLQYSYYQLGGQVTYSHCKPFDVTFGAGYNLEREFDFIHDGPDQKFKAVGAPYIKIAIETKF